MKSRLKIPVAGEPEAFLPQYLTSEISKLWRDLSSLRTYFYM